MTTIRALHHGAAAFLVVTALGLPGCSTSTTTSDQPSAQPTGPVTALLDEALGYMEDERYLQSFALRREEAVAACMASRGWTYTPDTSGYASGDSTPDLGGLSELEFARQYGYGLASAPSNSAGALPADATSANEVYLGSLSEEESTLYLVDLFGAGPSDGTAEEDDADRQAAFEASCTGQARAADAETGVLALDDDPRFAEVLRLAEELDRATLADPTVVAARDAWSSCMAGKGHAVTSGPESMHDELNTEYGTMMAQAAGGAPSAARLEEFRAREVAVAVADVTCRDEVGYAAALASATVAAETLFYAQHRDVLEAYVAAVAEVREK